MRISRLILASLTGVHPRMRPGPAPRSVGRAFGRLIVFPVDVLKERRFFFIQNI